MASQNRPRRRRRSGDREESAMTKLLLEVAGVALIVAGIAMVSVAAACVVGGIAVVAACEVRG